MIQASEQGEQTPAEEQDDRLLNPAARPDGEATAEAVSRSAEAGPMGQALGGAVVSPRVIAACLVVLVAVTYWQVRHFEYLNWDDTGFVQFNPHVQGGLSVEGIRWAFSAELLFATRNSDYWIPITHLSRMVDVELFGAGPSGPHLVNALIHGLATALLFSFLWLATAKRVPSAVCAALFAVHPVHIESVAWITERKDVLGGMFWMAGSIAYVQWFRKRGFLRYAAVCAMFVLGQLSKPIFLVFPCALVLMDFWPLRRVSFPELLNGGGRRKLVKLVVEKAPLFLLTVPFVLVTVHAAGRSIATLGRLPFSDRLAHATVAYASYLRRVIWPSGFSALYPPKPVPDAVAVVLCGLLLLAVTAGCFRAARRAPYLAVGWCWFLGVLFPLIGLVQVGPQQTADRFLHLPAVGIYMGLTWLGRDALSRLPGAHRRLVGGVVVALCLVGLTVANQRYLPHWRDSVAVWERAIAVSRSPNGLAHCKLGEALQDRGRIDEAILHFREAVAIIPNRDFAHASLSGALTEAGRGAEAVAVLEKAVGSGADSVSRRLSLGDALLGANSPAEAVTHYREALRLEPANLSAHGKLAAAISRQDGPAAAVAYLEEAQAKHGPRSPEILMALGGIALSAGNSDRAAECFREVLQVRPISPTAQANLGDIATARGQLSEAIEWYRRSLRSHHDRVETHVNLGGALLQAGRVEEAIEAYAFVVKRRPKWAVARGNLGQAFLAAGEPRAAIEQYGAALELDPSLTNIRQDLGAACARTGAFAPAREALERVIREAPSMVEAYANLALVSEAEGDRNQARRLWTTALSHRPDWPPALAALKRLEDRGAADGGSE